MAQTAPPKTLASATAPYTVLRAICMNGQRIDVGATVDMTALQYAEAHNAGKVGPLAAKAAPAKAPKAKAAPADAPAPTTPEETPNVPV
jgi:hypothetical protein